jgi:VanZ family protein
MLTTIVTASFDEIHQTFIPSRTGRWQDVMLDTVGAAALQVVVYLLSMRVLKQRQVTAPQPECISTR